ncbi:hypothetical protein LguiA_003617 [Lonicera macranthoides]
MGTTTTINQSIPSQTRRVSHTPTNSPSSSNYGGGGSKPLKKRTIDGDNKLKGDSVKYVIRQDGRDMGLIFPSRGLRQGDPIYPCLFLNCAEGLSPIFNDRCR